MKILKKTNHQGLSWEGSDELFCLFKFHEPHRVKLFPDPVCINGNIVATSLICSKNSRCLISTTTLQFIFACKEWQIFPQSSYSRTYNCVQSPFRWIKVAHVRFYLKSEYSALLKMFCSVSALRIRFMC